MSIYFNKKDLRNGMKIKLENGKEHLYLKDLASEWFYPDENETVGIDNVSIVPADTVFHGYGNTPDLQKYELKDVMEVFVAEHPYSIQSFFRQDDKYGWKSIWKIDEKELKKDRIKEEIDKTKKKLNDLNNQLDDLEM